jgi:hypothetical protein
MSFFVTLDVFDVGLAQLSRPRPGVPQGQIDGREGGWGVL